MQQLPLPPFRALLRQEFRRAWPAAEIRRALLFWFCAILFQIGISAWIFFTLRPASLPGSPGVRLPSIAWITVNQVVGFAGLSFAPLGWLLMPGARIPLPIIYFVMCLTAACRSAYYLVAPYYAAISISRARKYREVADFRGLGFAPGQILAALGGARLLPFLILTLLAAVGQVINYLSWRLTLPPGVAAAQPPLLVFLVQFSCSTLAALVNSMSLVCVSALCQRVWTAITLCFALELLLFPLVRWSLDSAIPRTPATILNGWGTLPFVLAELGFSILLLVVLAGFATRALRSETPTVPDARNLFERTA